MLILLPLVVATALSKAASVPQKRATVCNGQAELCDRSYGNITYIGAHDSFAFSDDPLALARVQEVDIPTQLNAGVRLLQAQGHANDGTVNFCHTSCLLFNGGTVQDYLTTVKTWLDANPNEVLTFIFTNPEGLSLPDIWAPAFVASGIADVAYVPPSLPVSQDAWPTLGALLAAGTRVVAFMDFGADGSDGGVVPFILPEFPMVWETPFGSTDPTFPCSVNRTAGPLPNDEHMYMINHSLNIDVFGSGVTISDPEDAPTTNGVTSILANANGCAQFADGRAPNFVLLDFVDKGQAFQAADILNGFATA